MNQQRICVLGGSGFVGRHLVIRLANEGHRVRVVTRHRERHKANLVHPCVDIVEGDIHDGARLPELFGGCDAVVFLPGILNQTRHQSFEDVHVNLPRQVVAACPTAGVGRLLHMSALGADPDGPSEYLRSKGRGEEAVHAAGDGAVAVTSFRPSLIFGPDDSLFNRFAGLLALSPVLPLACADARFAPVYVGDVVEAFCRALDDETTAGRKLELCGPEEFSLREIVEYTARLLGLRRKVVPLSDGSGRLLARLMQHLPGKPLTPDNLLSMSVPSTCGCNALPELGIHPTSVAAVMPLSLQRRGQRLRYYAYRDQARR